jgi:phage terminase small subunit
MLTPRQTRFVAHYLITLNATHAAIAAGYSKKTAKSIGAENLTKPDIAAAVQIGLAASLADAGATLAETLHANRCIVQADIAAIYDAKGHLLHPTLMPRDLRRAITRIKMKIENVTAGDGIQDQTLEVWFEPRGPAIDRDYKRHGLYVEKVEVSVTGDAELLALLAEGRKRNAEAS